MSDFLGIDTSNYTTSAAIYESPHNVLLQEKMLLPVKKGEKGIRQSDAVFHHTVQLPEIIDKLFKKTGKRDISAVGVSYAPRRLEGSYMPCFLTGISAATAVSRALSVPLYRFSHQEGHIAAVLYSAGRLELLNEPFIAFHVSGGTTEAVLVNPDNEHIINAEIVASSSDLKAGQAIDRVGVMLSLNFPAGPELEKLSEKSNAVFKIKPSMKNTDCSLSGVENKCKKMLTENYEKSDIALFCIDSVIAALDGMYKALMPKYGTLPVVFSGGVTSNKRIKNYFHDKYNAVFAEPAFSADNAAGTAVLSSIMYDRRK